LRCQYDSESGLCAKIDPRPYQNVFDQDQTDLAAAKARLDKDKANLAKAQAAFEDNQIPAKRRATTRKALDNSRKAYEQGQTKIKRDEATVVQLETALHAAEINLGDTEIVSPIDGTVISRNVEVGQTVAAGSDTPPLFPVAVDLTVIHVDTNFSENDISKVKPGDKVLFTVEAFPNHPFAGEVIQIGQSPRTIQNVTTYDVVISAPNPDLLLKPGMTATIRIVVDTRDDVLRAPNRALHYSPSDLEVPNGAGGPRMLPDGWSQLWILRDGKPTAIPVRLGLDDGTYTEIVEGEVRPSDELIIGESGNVLEKPAAMRLEPVYRPLLDARDKAGGGTNWDCVG
jgi:HlyD family secretion protein